MSIVIASMVILSISVAFAILLNRKLVETVFLAIAAIVAMLFSFGLLNREGSLWYGICFILFLATLSLSYTVFIFIKQREKLKDIKITSGILIYLCFLILAVTMNYGRTFQKWDEFTHWGFIVKHFFHMDAFGTVPHPYYELWMPNYLPGPTLVQYFFARFSIRFTEYYTYVGMNMMYYSMIMPFLKDIFTRAKVVGRVLLLIVFILIPLIFQLSPYVISHFYGSLMVDILMGMIFGFAILYYFWFRYEESLYGILLVSAATFMLTLTKSMGLLFSFGVFALMLVDVALFRRKNFATYLKAGRSFWFKTGRAFLLLLPFTLTLFVQLTWSGLLARTETSLNVEMPIISEIRNFFITGNLELEQLEIRLAFYEAMFEREIPFLDISTFWFSMVFLVLLFLLTIFFTERNVRMRFILAGVCLWIGFYIYKFIFALLYVFMFHPTEGINLASFERYMATYMLGMIVFLLMILMFAPLSFDIKTVFPFTSFKLNLRSVRIIFFVVLCICSFGVLFNATGSEVDTIARERTEHPDNFRPRPTALSAERWMDYFIETPAYFIDQGGRWVNIQKMRYELMPYARLANTGSYNIQLEKTSPDDVWSFQVTPEAWEEYVLSSAYKTVFIFRSDSTLETYFGHFFEGGVQEGMLYHVASDEGRLRLIPVASEQ